MTLEKACSIARKLEKSFPAFLGGVYGSCLTGSGRDADILMVAWRPTAIPPDAFIEDILDAKIKEPTERGSCAWSTLLLDKDNELIDIRWTKYVDLTETFKFRNE